MPLLVRPIATPPPSIPDERGRLVDVLWTDPEGAEWDLMSDSTTSGIVVLHDGVSGLGAAPRVLTRRALGTGGTLARWSHADERLMTLPLLLYAESPDALLTLRRELTRSFVATAPPGGTPRPGVLRIARADGSWREVGALYLDGLGWIDEAERGIVEDVVVLQLVAPDPWFYGPRQPELDFRPAPTRSYLAPYETVSPTVTLGTQTIRVLGDAPASPVWTINGPVLSASAEIVDGPGWTFGSVAPGETITIDVARSTVTDQSGANRIGGLSWPSSALFELPPGEVMIRVTLLGGLAEISRVGLSYRPRLETA